MPGRFEYNVILMRDTSTLLRFRISTWWLQVGAIILALVLLSGVAGGAFGLYQFSRNISLQSENQQLKSGLRQAELKLNRLANVADIMDSYDQEELQSMSTTVMSKSGSGLMVPVDLSEIFAKEDMQIISVDNVQVKYMGENLRFSYDVNNLQTSGTVAGEASFSLITRDGISIDLPHAANEFGFEIARFKPIKLLLTIPGGLDKNDIFAIRMRIKQETGTTIFSQTFPLSHVLS